MGWDMDRKSDENTPDKPSDDFVFVSITEIERWILRLNLPIALSDEVIETLGKRLNDVVRAELNDVIRGFKANGPQE